MYFRCTCGYWAKIDGKTIEEAIKTYNDWCFPKKN